MMNFPRVSCKEKGEYPGQSAGARKRHRGSGAMRYFWLRRFVCVIRLRGSAKATRRFAHVPGERGAEGARGAIADAFGDFVEA